MSPMESMEHDGSPPHTQSASRLTPSRADSTTRASTSMPRASGLLSSHPQLHTAVSGSPAGSQGLTTPRRIFCPVVTCAEALTSTNRHYRDFKSIKSHLDAHCTGHLSGAIPTEFLNQNSYTQCRVCDKVVHTKFQGICVKCRPSARRREQINSLRRGNNNRCSTNVSFTTSNSDQANKSPTDK